MKLVYYDLNLKIKLSKDKLNFLIIENKREFDKFILALNSSLQRKDESVDLFKESEKENIYKIADLIKSPLDFTYEKKEVQKKLYSSLMEDLECSDISLELVETSSKLIKIVEKLEFKSDYPIDYIDLFSNDMFFKLFDIRLKQVEGTYLERLMEYTRNIHRLLGKNIFFLLSALSYLTEKDLEYLTEFANYEEIYFIFIQPYQEDLKTDVNQCIIDVDLCLI